MTIDLSEIMKANSMFLHKLPFMSFSLYFIPKRAFLSGEVLLMVKYETLTKECMWKIKTKARTFPLVNDTTSVYLCFQAAKVNLSTANTKIQLF